MRTTWEEDTMTRSAMRIFLGLALTAHGLGNAVLPLRGADWVAPGTWSYPIVLLYILAIIGFVKVGLGLLGVRPLAGDLRAMVVFAGACSLAGQWVLWDADLWFGTVLSVALPVVTLLFLSREREPASEGHPVVVRRRWHRVLADAAGVAFFAWVAVAATMWPYSRTWGAVGHEWVMTLPGDDSARQPAFELLHGVTIEAPPSAVWPWLVQIGQDRAGFYSYDRLERFFGADIRNVRELRSEWQTRAVGDRVPATQAGYLWGLFGQRPGWTVERLEANRALVLDGWGAFVLVPELRGGTRLLIRSTISHERIPVWAAALNFTAFQLPHFIMQRRMMLNIKELAEGRVRSST
jgi:hypothetical protein